LFFQRERGFTLLEVLIALVIVGLALAMLTGAVSDSLLRAEHISDQDRALVVADSLLARFGYDLPLRMGMAQGMQNGLYWAISVTPAASAGTDVPVAALDLRLFTPSQRFIGEWQTLRVVAP